MRRTTVYRSVLVASCLGLLSCGHDKPLISEERRVDTSEEVANVFVSAYPAVPWTSIQDKLEPNHDLSIKDARDMAAVTTQSQVNQFLSTFAAGLAIGLPSRTHSSSTTTTDGTTTSTSTRKLEPGAVPASTGASPVALSDASLAADLSKVAPALGVDASTQLTVGTAVYQLAKILDNQISKSIAPEGYQAHLLTFQVNLQPRSRNLPYDTYVNLTLMPASWTKAFEVSKDVASDASAMPAVMLYPLVISDAMESASVSKSVEVIRQAALALSGIVGNVGIGAKLDKGSDDLKALSGSDRNSIVTVGRVSDHTLRMRFGAQLQGTSAKAIVPRTHNVSVVVFTKTGDADATHIDRLAVVTETSFFDAKSGAEVASTRNTPQGRAKLTEEVRQSLDEFGYELAKTCTDPRNLLRALDRGDYRAVGQCVALSGQAASASQAGASKSAAQPATAGIAVAGANLSDRVNVLLNNPDKLKLDPAEDARLRRVVADLMTKQVNSRFSKFLVQLTPFKQLELPIEGQLTLLNDDRTAAKVILREGRYLAAGKLRARLKVKPDTNEYVLLPTSLEVDPDGKTVTVVFPSLLGNGLMAYMPGAAGAPAQTDLDPTMSLVLETRNVKEGQSAWVESKPYAVRLLRPEKKAVGNPLSTASSVVIADGNGSARITLQIGEWDAAKLGALAVRVTGAEVRATLPARTMDAALRAIPVTANSSVTLDLGNVTTARAVQISAVAKKAVVGEAIVLPVVQTAVAAK